RLRVQLGIEKWQVFGGSWGSTLSLTYAQTHPDRVTELVLRGIFMLRRAELHWFYQEGASWLYPDAWENYLAPIPPEERHDLIDAYYKRLTGDDAAEKAACAKAWAAWEGGTVSLKPSIDRIKSFSSESFAIAFARIECHYFVNGGFFERDDQLLANIDTIRHIPTTIVQGRYDVVTPMKSAWELHRAWPEAELKIIGDAGHAASEPGIIDALLRATDKYASQ
ncbi:MAG: prolyl aminopeptidase, partial [Pseudomonadota bacterium]